MARKPYAPNQPTKRTIVMKQYNIEIFKSLRANAVPMNKFDLVSWLEAMLSVTDISATVKGCVDERGFMAHTVTLSDGHGANRSFIVPVLSDEFTFDDYGIYHTYGIIAPKARWGKKNMYLIAYKKGYILISYEATICFYDLTKNAVYLKQNSFEHSSTTSKHIHIFLTYFVNATAIKMFAK